VADLDAGHAVHHLAREMQRGAEAGGGVGVFARLLLERREQFLEVRGEQVLLRGQDVRQLPHAGDEGEILARTVRELGVAADREHVGGDAAEPDRVAVRRRLRDRVRAQHAAGAGLVLDHEGLTGQFAHLLAEHARERVGGTAGRKAVDILHGTDRPGLCRPAYTWRQKRRGDERADGRKRATAVDG
jgi:hypothetical protein